MDEEASNPYPPKPSPARMSRTPSWVLLGFLIGAAFVWLLPGEADSVKPPEPPAPEKAPEKKTTAAKHPQKRILTDIEAVFEVYGRYAVWDQNKTEVGLWNAQKNAYADFYEVLRVDEFLYFRSIPRLTRPMLANAEHSEIPLIFTETEEMRRQWLESRKELAPAYVAPQTEAPKLNPLVEKPGN